MVANTSKLVHSLQPQVAANGSVYYCLECDVVLLFGLTELKAQISWMHEVRPSVVSLLSKLCDLLRFTQGVEKR